MVCSSGFPPRFLHPVLLFRCDGPLRGFAPGGCTERSEQTGGKRPKKGHLHMSPATGTRHGFTTHKLRNAGYGSGSSFTCTLISSGSLFLFSKVTATNTRYGRPGLPRIRRTSSHIARPRTTNRELVMARSEWETPSFSARCPVLRHILILRSSFPRFISCVWR